MCLKKVKCIVVIFFTCHTLLFFSQLENANWAINNHKLLNTSTNPPTSGTCALPAFSEIPSSISDASGNLLLYTNGVTLFNGSHSVVPNGTGLIGGPTVLQKLPGSATIFYIFTANSTGFYYSIVDITLAAGQGSVTTKNLLLASYTGLSGINGVRHCNGTDFWIMVSKKTNNQSIQFDARHFSSSGINPTPVSSLYGPLTYTLNTPTLVKITFSPRKNKLSIGGVTEFGLMDFDPATGIASNSVVLGAFSPGICGATEFSPDGTKLYGLRQGWQDFFQWDLCAGDSAAIRNSRYPIVITLTSTATFFYDICLGLNGKIYLPRSGYNLSVVNSPNLPGAACNPSFDVQPPTMNTYLLQNFIKMTGFHLTPPPFTYTLNACQTVYFSQTTANTGTTSYCNSVPGSFTGVLWNFGDPTTGSANSSTLTNPNHMFSAPGNYTVQLYRINSCSLSTDTSTQIISIPGPSISINISASVSCASFGTATVSVPSATTNYNYTWIPTFQTGSVAVGLSPGIYSVFLSTGSSTCDFVKIINLIPSVAYSFSVVSSSSINCIGPNTATAQVLNVTGGSGGQTYFWTNGSQNFTTVTVYSLSVGLWSVTINDTLTHCLATRTLYINPPPTTALLMSSSSASACVGSSVNLTGLNLGGLVGTTYTWSNGAQTPSITVSENQAGTYVYTLSSTTIYHCFSTNTILIQFIANPILTLVNTSVCVNSSTVIIAGGNGSSYQWAYGNGLSTLNSATVIASPSSTQIYSVTSYANNCSTTGTVMLTVLSAPTITLVNTTNRVCPGDTVYLSGAGGQEYLWKGPFRFEKSGQFIRFMANYLRFAGNYTLFISDQFGCTNSSVTTIEELPLPDGSLINFVSEACVPSCKEYTFSPYINMPTESNWTLNGLNFSGNTFSTCISEAGFYTLLGTIRNTSTGCKANLSYNLNLHSKPKANFEYTPINPTELLDEVQFTNTSEGEEIKKYNWYFNDNTGFKSNMLNCSYLYELSGNYPVVLKIENKWGCKDTIIKVISVKSDFLFYIPNSFTPNDDQRNDIFLPVVRSVRLYDFRIFDRWGEELFSSQLPQLGWDGNFNKVPCKQDIYTWLIKITTMGGEQMTKTGMVLLMR